MRGVGGVIVVIWLLIGLFAAFQRGYLTGEREVNCRTTADTLLTVVAGPLNYLGVNPKIDCEELPDELPQPSE